MFLFSLLWIATTTTSLSHCEIIMQRCVRQANFHCDSETQVQLNRIFQAVQAVMSDTGRRTTCRPRTGRATRWRRRREEEGTKSTASPPFLRAVPLGTVASPRTPCATDRPAPSAPPPRPCEISVKLTYSNASNEPFSIVTLQLALHVFQKCM